MTHDAHTHETAIRRWETRCDQAIQTLGGGTAEEALERLLAEHPVAMPAVLDHLHRRLSDNEIAAWLTAPDTWTCKGQRPIDLLDDDSEAVVEAARHAVADTWD